MYIYKIIIKNFRNIDFLEWNPDKKVNVLFGHNGCGKSNIAQALNLLFSTSRKGDYFEINDYYKKNEKNKILIQVWLNEIDDAEIEDKDRAIQYISEDDKIVNEDTDLQGCREMLIVQLTNDDDRRMLWSLVTNTEEIKFNLLARKSVNYNFVSTQRSPIKELSFGYQTLLQELIKEEIDGKENIKDIKIDRVRSGLLLEIKNIMIDFKEQRDLNSKLDCIESIISILKENDYEINYSILFFIKRCLKNESITNEKIDKIMLSRQYINSYSNISKGLYIMTMHQSKGKEFDNVFIIDTDNIKKETNLSYVAHSRMKEKIYPVKLIYEGTNWNNKKQK